LPDVYATLAADAIVLCGFRREAPEFVLGFEITLVREPAAVAAASAHRLHRHR
jgi:hypothetical protein